MTMTEVNERSSSSVTPDDEDDELLTPRVIITFIIKVLCNYLRLKIELKMV